jgi:hypothetical protein
MLGVVASLLRVLVSDWRGEGLLASRSKCYEVIVFVGLWMVS